mmetsp:Transcript_11112/g.19018  ORF Transcript_11112/g.19018 Transcript_11112/m.19018 type:complete len:1156 (-) Transcript_11112:219-3686(-)
MRSTTFLALVVLALSNASQATASTPSDCPSELEYTGDSATDEANLETCLEELVACYEDDLEDVSPATSGDRVLVQAAGATFPLRLYQDAIFAFRFYNTSISVTYEGIGSGRGKCRIESYFYECSNVCTANSSAVDTYGDEFIDFAGSDAVVEDDMYDTYTDLQMYPAVAGAAVPVYNLPGLDALDHTLVLSKTTVAQIFRKCDSSITGCETGSIWYWNDTKILALNYDSDNATRTTLIHEALQAAGEIYVAVRSDTSGTSEIFKGALSQFEDAFATQVGDSSDNSDYNAIVTKHDSNVGVAGYVALTESAIGYSVLGEALTIGLTRASIKISNSSAAVEATTTSVNNAMVEKGLDFGTTALEQERLVATIYDAQGSQAWPIAGYTYFVIRKNTTRDGTSCANRLATQNFLLWFYENSVSQSIAESLGFSPLSDEVRDTVTARIKSDMYCDGKQVYQETDTYTPTIAYAGASVFEVIFDQYELSYGVVDSATEFNSTFISTTASKAVNRLISTKDSDAPTTIAVVLSSSQATTPEHVVSIPYVGVGLGVSVNFCSSTADTCPDVTQINMTVNVLGRVLSQNITTWDHEDILAINPNIEQSVIENQTIIVVEEEGSYDELKTKFVEYIREVGNLPNFTIVASITKDSLEAVRSAVAVQAFSIAYNPTIGESDQLEAFYVSVGVDGAPYVQPTLTAIGACATEDAYDSTTGNLDLSSVAGAKATNGCYPLVDTMNLAVRSKYTSAAGDCGGDSDTTIGEVNTQFLGFLLDNVIEQGGDSSVEEPLRTQGLYPVSTLDFNIEKNLELISSITCDGVSILTPEENKNLIPLSVVGLGIALVIICSLLIIFLAVWVQVNRRQKIILISSPPFLLQILLGALISVSAIIPLSLQDDDVFYTSSDTSGLDMACQAAPFLYSIGFAYLYSSLWLKTWRLGRIFDNPKLKRIFITNRKMQAFQGLLLIVIIALNIVWIEVDPLRWERVDLTTDSQGNVLTSYGRCYSEKSLVLVAPLAAILLLSLLYGIYLIYQSRRIPSEYGEGRYIGFALTIAFESLVLGIPVLFLASNNPTTSFIIKMCIILATSAATVGFLFLPKVWHVYAWGWTTGITTDSEKDYSFTHSKPRLQDTALQSSSFIDSFKDHTRSFMEPNGNDHDHDEETV